MKIKQQASYHFSAEKDCQLIEERGIGFKDIMMALENGGLLDIIDHPNQAKYPGQMMYIVQMYDYVFAVPFIDESEGGVFLKTIIPSRKMRRKYKAKVEKNENDEDEN